MYVSLNYVGDQRYLKNYFSDLLVVLYFLGRNTGDHNVYKGQNINKDFGF